MVCRHLLSSIEVAAPCQLLCFPSIQPGLQVLCVCRMGVWGSRVFAPEGPVGHTLAYQ